MIGVFFHISLNLLDCPLQHLFVYPHFDNCAGSQSAPDTGSAKLAPELIVNIECNPSFHCGLTFLCFDVCSISHVSSNLDYIPCFLKSG
jgi:hypothetical protein